MELIWNEINAVRLASRGTEQTELEGTLPPPQGRSVAEILDYTAEVGVDSCRTEDGRLTATGRITAKLIASDESGERYAFTSGSTFSHTVSDPAIEAGMSAQVLPRLAQLSVRRATDGRIMLSAAVDMDYSVTTTAPLRVLSGVAGVSDMEIKTETLEHSRRVELGSSMLHLSEELSESGAESVLSHSIALSVRDTAFENGGVTVGGIAEIAIIAKSAEGEPVQITRSLPFRENVATDGSADEVFAVAELRSSDARALGTEFSLISVDADIELRVFALRRGRLTLPLDAFSPSINFSCIKSKTELISCLGGADSAHTLRENLSVPEGLSDIFSTVSVHALPILTSKSLRGGEASIEGLLMTRLIYRAASGRLYAFNEDVPFSLRTGAPEGATDADIRLGCTATVTGGSARSAQITYNIGVSAEFFRTAEAETVVGLAENAADSSIEALPTGLIIHTADEGDGVFDIARRFRIPSSRILELNPQLKDGLRGGDKVLLIV
ncbi:MAG: hypothetical protein IKZ82_14040 [Clostridia bacterium]|nr:hypothetical protein [Clostridia bacterium]